MMIVAGVVILALTRGFARRLSAQLDAMNAQYDPTR